MPLWNFLGGKGNNYNGTLSNRISWSFYMMCCKICKSISINLTLGALKIRVLPQSVGALVIQMSMNQRIVHTAKQTNWYIKRCDTCGTYNCYSLVNLVTCHPTSVRHHEICHGWPHLIKSFQHSKGDFCMWINLFAVCKSESQADQSLACS